MAEQNAVDLVVKLLGGTVGVGAIAVFVRGLFSGTIISEKEMRDDLRTEVGRLRTVQEQQGQEIDELRLSIRTLTTTNLHLISTRAEARALVNTLERELRRTPTVWPPDPTGGP
ncbi:hypothetical protein [Deinococcus arenicola]|uniref:DUF2746 domain-containing protein n=1 Tax=Deinococcus arenicola TaxID=2994950 RepID=A0ABU4DUB4_9DEIO|nr:hypothetical protein [Deinococcus sp. ZS9-10]MDV6376021.1 hypothetical protein [Deinococcus sp. ZS9-10]